ncbi:DNA polymerase III subunit chi [Rhodocyclus tenuis]|uniref:DNA polymerase III subunit chi n=1 Tax=Rhodocyclus gracilis TaxID=2929842 RepID=UPI001298BD39|nr:DNA polymerase III subunit chi [Rhodocyclus gracilis]MRD73175.1 DNA polymerase III subunit chi [Rhodocyclus gracilis]
MTHVFFYHDATDRVVAAARLIGKACMQQKALLVFAPDDGVADALDRQLWLHPVGGFIPHVRAESPLAAQTPVVIARTLDAPDRCERLVNLGDDIPPDAERFGAIIEVVGDTPEMRQAGRERVRRYREYNFPVKFFDLSGHGE